MKYRILLYYKYTTIENPEEFAARHLEFCNSIGIKGRILVAAEGINGTVSGTVEQTDAYMEHMHADPQFADLWFKIDDAPKHAFRKMKVKARQEIVNWSMSAEDDVDPNDMTGKYLTPKEWHELMQREDVIIIDGRNDYEYDIGHFKGAIRPEVETTREFPQWIRENLSEFKDKKVMTYCTGGIRCEKLSGFLVKEGFQDVSQLHGGIVSYGKDPEVKGEGWEGKCYVFDERIAVPINQVEDKVIATCYHCGKPHDRYVNCANPFCHKMHVCCEECEPAHLRSCSKECEEHPANRYELELQMAADDAQREQQEA
ncbi:rhodanese-related sulfurtransferase [Tumebacillus permanentifrigoris]|uniref:tRNA uridine(34) hydroxylase n=1 Tax=Tumebacillus permanentifrigoris TaxID=378543 RepID=A0A316DUU5_9BACL|nr:rhodanese-related sulfurtransferase [Tumebacillus permanentifrigoris]PWK12842.1 UPF0176 protein [Tumebacillus permanentifrigoris]